MARVRTYTRTQNGRRQTVGQHTRSTSGSKPSLFTLSPSRAGRNFGRMFRSAKAGKRLTAIGFGGLAVGEIGSWLGFKAAGGALIGVGLLIGVVGGALWMSARR